MSVLLDALFDEPLAARLTSWQMKPSARVILNVQPTGWRFQFVLIENHLVVESVTGDYGINTKEKVTDWIGEGKRAAVRLEYKESTSHPSVGMNVISFFEENLTSSLSFATKAKVNNFTKGRDALLIDSKRGRPNLPSHIINWVFARSSGICEFEGCSKILFRDDQGHYGYFGYLAHIVAANEKGPRGDEVNGQSPVLADSPYNLLLCCDVHHRLIDKVDPDSYSVDTLNNMLRKREEWRTHQVESLSYPTVYAFAFISDIAGRTTTFSHHDARKALFSSKLMPASERVAEYPLRDTQGGNDVNDPGYWATFLRAFRPQILSLHASLRGSGQLGVDAQELAIFPLGNMPSLLLGGWLVGESRRVHLFHFRRNEGTWVRNINVNDTDNQFEWEILNSDVESYSHILLTLELTADIREDVIAEDLRQLPRIRIYAENKGSEVVSSEARLNSFKQVLSEAWAHVVDTMKVSEVSICTIAPAVAVFALGMKLQVRMHPTIHMHQMAPDRPSFRAFSLERNTIISPNEISNNTLQLESS